MQNKIFIPLVIIIAALLCNCAPAPVQAEIPVPTPTETTVQRTDPAQIQESTVLITAQSNSSYNDMSLGHGIGTLVEHQGESYLVTHNHWGDVLEDKTATVELRDAQNRLIVPMYASAFKELILYQDPGTLVLRATPELLASVRPARIEIDKTLEPGAIVQVAYRQLPDRISVAVLHAEVVQVCSFEGELVYEIRSLDGQGLQKGDSGGGVWHNGRLVGNNWTILVEKGAEGAASEDGQMTPTVSTESFTAVLPEWTEG